MFKKINIFLIGFLLINSINLKIGYFIYLPIVLIYLLKDINNMYYIYPSSLLSIFLFLQEELISYLIIILLTTIIVYYLKYLINNNKIKKYQIILVNISYIIIVNSIYLYLVSNIKLNLMIFFLYMLISFFIYMFLTYYLFLFSSDYKQIKERLIDTYLYKHFIWFEMLIAFCAIISCVVLPYSFIVFFVGSYFAMYFSRKYQNLESAFFGIVISIVIYIFTKNVISYVIVFASTIYLINSPYTFGLYNLLLTCISITQEKENIFIFAILMLVSIIFEIIYRFLIVFKSSNDLFFKEIHEDIQKNVNNEILKFAGFLDQFVIGFGQSVSLNEKINQGINTIIKQHCNNCPKQEECYKRHKKDLLDIFKKILLNKEIEDEFNLYCPKYSSLLNTSKLLNYQINYENPNITKSDANNYILLNQITGVSMALKNYVIDTSTRDTIDFNTLQKAKNHIIDLDLDLTYYEVKKNYVKDFLIFIGIKNSSFKNIKQALSSLFEILLKEEISVVLVKEENSTIYINVIPKIKINISYAFGSIPSSDEIISGDNYLIKEDDNGHMIFAISDGMGKGYMAFYESDMTLRLIEEIVKLNIESSTALCILNSFYLVQDYLERYATLDFLDINRNTGMATFYKMGATTSYLFRKNQNLIKIENKNLPLGLDEEVDQVEYMLQQDDLIIMSSDGIIENIINEETLENHINNFRTLSPTQLVHEIFNFTTNSSVKAKDDMTLIILKVQTN